MLLALCVANAGSNGIAWSKSHIVPHFDCPELINAVMPLTMPSASSDANTITKCITWPKIYLTYYFHYLHQANAVVPVMMPLTSTDADPGANGITWPKILCHISCSSPWPNKCNGTIDDTCGIMWHWQQHPWHPHHQKHYIAHCFNHFYVMNAVVILTMPLASHWCWCQCQ